MSPNWYPDAATLLRWEMMSFWANFCWRKTGHRTREGFVCPCGPRHRGAS